MFHTMWKFGQNWPTPFKNASFHSILAYSTSFVAPSEKSSVNTNRKSTMSSPMSLRWTVYIAPKPPKGTQKHSVQNLNNNLW